jgi:hypothetical protein
VFSQAAERREMLDSIFCYVCEKNIKHADIVMRQVIMETGWLRSKFLMSRNNLFGFRRKYYMSFENWRESVDYYKNWQDKYFREGEESYEEFLSRVRYGSRKYVRYLMKIKYNRNCILDEEFRHLYEVNPENEEEGEKEEASDATASKF